MTPQSHFMAIPPVVATVRLPTYSCRQQSGADDVVTALQRLAEQMQWADGRGPFGCIIPHGARVLIKPNLVLHRNLGSGDLAPLITHPCLIRAAVEAALQSGASEVSVGDAPLQSCDFQDLLHSTGLDTWARDLQKRDARFKGIRDFRRTKCSRVHRVRMAIEDCQPAERYALFNLQDESLLESISGSNPRFRVSDYDCRRLAGTHHSRLHQYLISKDVLQADLVINLPKLKTHKKTGMTGALKNSIGINGNKEYLPHHRLGGSETGGDCYPGGSIVKLAREHILDRENRASSSVMKILWRGLSFALSRISRLQGDHLGIDGSWHGNDTLWRTCLDINRVLLYGTSDGTMAQNPQRRVIHIVDAVVAGQGDGPLAPDALPMGLLLGSDNAVAADWVGAVLLGYNPSKLPIIMRAFDRFRWPLVASTNSAIFVMGDLGKGPADDLVKPRLRAAHPIGWRDAAAAQAIAWNAASMHLNAMDESQVVSSR